MAELIEAEEVKVKSLGKALALLSYFTQSNPERGITELAELSGLLKSSVHNMVSTFEAYGFLEKNETSGKYRLGAAILKLSNSLYLSHDIRNVLRPRLEDISTASGENVYLATLYEDQVIYVDAVYPSGSYSGRSIIGINAPLYCTGVGKAILAELTETQIEAITARGLPAFTPHTITEPTVLKAELSAIRKRGYAIDDMEHEFGIRCVAVAVRNIRGAVVASVSISGPSPRFSEERIAEHAAALMKMANEMRSFIRR
jgi:DNA-binding IclR family transcriptional regulator